MMMYEGEKDEDGFDYHDYMGGSLSPKCIDLLTDLEKEKEEKGEEEEGEDEEELATCVQPEAVYSQKLSKSEKLSQNWHCRYKLFISLTFDCIDCKKNGFESEILYKRHLRNDHFIENHRCYLPYCLQSFRKNIYLQQHLAKWHPKEVDWRCSFCEIQTHSNHNGLKQHIELNHQLGTFVCNLKSDCEFETINREQMLNHFREVHHVDPKGNFTIKNYICNFEGCQQAFSTSTLVRRHQLFHLKVKPYICSLCGYESEVRHAIIMHIRAVHMKLPATKYEQQAKNILDDRDPATYFCVDNDK